MKHHLTFLSLLILLLSSCKEEIPIMDSTTPEVYFLEFSSDGSLNFVLRAEISSGGSAPVIDCGFYCADNISMQNAGKYSAQLTVNTFSSEVTLKEKDRKYYVCAYISNGRTEICSDVKTIEATGESIWEDFRIYDLSSTASANCYIVYQNGTYKFKAVKGNSSTSVGDVAWCEILWESFGTDTAPSRGDLIKSVSYCDGFISFKTSSTFRKGNAVIAAKNSSGTILWSWHIWLTDQPKGQIYNNNAGVMMDRNLGATSATPGDVGALGLLYQWGRKDPFLSSSSISSNAEAKSSIPWPSSVSSSSSTGTIAYAIAHPTTFIKSNSNNYDWYYSTGSSTDDTRWQSSKTIYDPCPVGWRVPDGRKNGIWSQAFGTSGNWTTSSNGDSTNKGMDFSKTDRKLGSSGPIWYPVPGVRDYSRGVLNYVGSSGYYWTVSSFDDCAFTFVLTINGNIDPASQIASFLASGLSVRCQKE